MRLLENWLSADDIAILKNYWEKNSEQAYINGRSKETRHPMADVAEYIDKRLLITPNTTAYQVIEDAVKRIFPGEDMGYVWANYQRQALPHTLHVDEYGRNRTGDTWTVVFAVDDEPRFKTLLFKEKFNTSWDLNLQLRDLAGKKAPLVSNVSAEQDLEHMFWDTFGCNAADYLTLEGTFSYKAGSGILFDTNNAHCTSNWRKYPDIAYRDLVQLHIGVNNTSKESYNDKEHTKKGDSIPDPLTLTIKE